MLRHEAAEVLVKTRASADEFDTCFSLFTDNGVSSGQGLRGSHDDRILEAKSRRTASDARPCFLSVCI